MTLLIEQGMASAHQLIQSISTSVIGKPETVKLVVTAFIAGGHVLLEDVPGTGKTLLAKSLARSFAGDFKRIQFTSDLMPSDVTGNSLFNPKLGEFQFSPGPIFAHIVLADEINRATPRTQSSLLEVMEEYQVTIDGHTYPMRKPFFVIATQNPLEFYGTFPLPESQLDRFFLSLSMGYPTFPEEISILKLHLHNTRENNTTSLEQQLKPLLDPSQVQELTQLSRQVEVSDEVMGYLTRLIQKTRNHNQITLGASTRSAVALLRGAQAMAMLEGQRFVTPDHVKLLLPHVLSHRIALHQDATRQEKQQVLQDILNTTAV